jgi:hypothetical protein
MATHGFPFRPSHFVKGLLATVSLCSLSHGAIRTVFKGADTNPANLAIKVELRHWIINSSPNDAISFDPALFARYDRISCARMCTGN